MIQNSHQAISQLNIQIKKIIRSGFLAQVKFLKSENERLLNEFKEALYSDNINAVDFISMWETRFPNEAPPLSARINSTANLKEFVLSEIQSKLESHILKKEMALFAQSKINPKKLEEKEDEFLRKKFNAGIQSVKNDAILGGSTFGPDFLKSGNYLEQVAKIKRMRNMKVEGTLPNSQLKVLLESNARARAARCGNCFEVSNLMMEYLWKYPEGITQIDIVSGKSYRDGGFDHVFCLVNRNPDSKIDDPSTWGDQTYLVDPWSSSFYKLHNYPDTIRNLLNTGHTLSKVIPRKQNPWQLSKVPTHEIKIDLNLLQSIDPKITPYTPNIQSKIHVNDYYDHSRPIKSKELHDILLKNIEDIKSTLKTSHQAKFSSALQEITQNPSLKPLSQPSNEQTHYNSIVNAIQKGDVQALLALHPDVSKPVVVPKKYNSKTKQWDNVEQSILNLAIQIAGTGDPTVNTLILKILKHNQKIDINEPIDNLGNALIQSIGTQNSGLVKALLKVGADPSSSLILNPTSSASALFLAAELGNLEIVKAIYNACPKNLESPTVSGMTPLIAATYSGHFEVAQFLISKNANINVRGDSKATPLHIAASNGDLKLLKLFLENGAKADEIGPWNKTPLFIACEKGHIEIIKELLKPKYKVDPNYQNLLINNCNPLMATINNSFIDCADYLLSLPNIDVNHSIKPQNFSPLSFCFNLRWDSLFKKCLDKGADPNQPISDKQTTLLNLIIEQQRLELFNILAKSKVDVNLNFQKGSLSSLQRALKKGADVALISKWLIENGADIKYITDQGQTCLSIACQSLNPDLKSIRLLIKKGLDPNKWTTSVESAPLYIAYSQYNTTLFALLLKKGADPLKIKLPSGVLLLHQLAFEGRSKELKIAIESIQPKEKALKALEELYPNELNGNCSALQMACIYGNTQCAKVLLEFGVNPNPPRLETLPPLIYAINLGKLPLVKLLLKHNTKLEHQFNQYSQSALFHAALIGQNDILKFLVSQVDLNQNPHILDSLFMDPVNNETLLHRIIQMPLPLNDHLFYIKKLSRYLHRLDLSGKTPISNLFDRIGDVETVLDNLPPFDIHNDPIALHPATGQPASLIQYALHTGNIQLFKKLLTDPKWKTQFSEKSIASTLSHLVELYPNGPHDELSKELFESLSNFSKKPLLNLAIQSTDNLNALNPYLKIFANDLLKLDSNEHTPVYTILEKYNFSDESLNFLPNIDIHNSPIRIDPTTKTKISLLDEIFINHHYSLLLKLLSNPSWVHQFTPEVKKSVSTYLKTQFPKGPKDELSRKLIEEFKLLDAKMALSKILSKETLPLESLKQLVAQYPNFLLIKSTYGTTALFDLLNKFQDNPAILDIIPKMDIYREIIFEDVYFQDTSTLLNHTLNFKLHNILLKLISDPKWNTQFTPNVQMIVLNKLIEHYPNGPNDNLSYELFAALDKLNPSSSMLQVIIENETSIFDLNKFIHYFRVDIDKVDQQGKTPIFLLLEKFPNYSDILNVIPDFDITNTLVFKEKNKQDGLNLIDYIISNQRNGLLLKLLTEPRWLHQLTPEIQKKINTHLNKQFPNGPVDDISLQLLNAAKNVKSSKALNTFESIENPTLNDLEQFTRDFNGDFTLTTQWGKSPAFIILEKFKDNPEALNYIPPFDLTNMRILADQQSNQFYSLLGYIGTYKRYNLLAKILKDPKWNTQLNLNLQKIIFNYLKGEFPYGIQNNISQELFSALGNLSNGSSPLNIAIKTSNSVSDLVYDLNYFSRDLFKADAKGKTPVAVLLDKFGDSIDILRVLPIFSLTSQAIEYDAKANKGTSFLDYLIKHKRHFILLNMIADPKWSPQITDDVQAHMFKQLNAQFLEGPQRTLTEQLMDFLGGIKGSSILHLATQHLDNLEDIAIYFKKYPSYMFKLDSHGQSPVSNLLNRFKDSPEILDMIPGGDLQTPHMNSQENNGASLLNLVLAQHQNHILLKLLTEPKWTPLMTPLAQSSIHNYLQEVYPKGATDEISKKLFSALSSLKNLDNTAENSQTNKKTKTSK